jgi:hypothetical protein
MAIATAKQREATAAGYVATALYASLHTADPGTTGANEVTGGSPAYARKAITWNAGVEDGSYTSNEITFDVPPGTLTHVGIWSAVTAGDYLDKGAINVTFSSQGVYKITLTYNQS